MKIAMIGCGKLGLPVAEVMADHYNVVGYDLTPNLQAKIPMTSNIAEAMHDRDIIFVAVPTPHDSEYGGEKPIADLPARDFNYSIVQDVLKKISLNAKDTQLIVLISTVLPGTIRNHLRHLLTKGKFIYNPYVAAMGSIKQDMANPECLIIGTEDGQMNEDAIAILKFYEPICGNKCPLAIGTWDEAEAIKVFYNTYISAKLSIVNMIQDVAERNGNINVDVVTNALMSATHRITSAKYLTAGLGDAGPCHPRDNIALRFLSERLNLGYDLFQAIMNSRERQAKNLAYRLIEIANAKNLPVVIHGKSYKPYIEYTHGSYSLLLGYFVEAAGVPVFYVDPLTGDSLTEPMQAVYLMAHNPAVSYAGTDITKENTEYYCVIPSGSVILDPWRTILSYPGCDVIHYGNTRCKC
ncbi:NAD-binding, UDP-glucose/GDP-mannose dehydrogenase family protein [Methyloglobulus morosus KoM1]|uniref:UDP-glucose 6-dehydrogenase n=1 Tax=Methyloglobulus morosus KoM1 TaxID=1116472 RepID=V5C9K8_9GAMM|nr:NAD-binding, UDP-glucose/GDP-mannose dehydrogenase [Methyloglobulus morosus]ESS73488.1 NAD-binding, UDP-glucose/GDP-mannose dehydrogenase family protein [Methyloglobulus morosus KoM1]